MPPPRPRLTTHAPDAHASGVPKPSQGRQRPHWIRALLVIAVILALIGVALFSYEVGRRHGVKEVRTALDTAEEIERVEEAPALTPEPPSDPPARDQLEPPASDEAQADPGFAIVALSDLEVAPPAPRQGYERDQFGWRTFDHDANGCDIRNDVLRRDLVDVQTREETHGCKVETGTLYDPYTATEIDFVIGAGPTSDGGVQVDHVVSLFNAWVSGAQEWDEETMVVFGNDPLNLLAVDGGANQAKGGSDAANWLPPDSEFHCPFVARQVAVKLEYDLSVTPAESSAMSEVLSACPEERLPTASESATP